MNGQELKDKLAGFYGTEKYHQHGFSKGFVLTDGAAFLRQNAGNGCFWLFDAIASYQPQCRKDASLRDMQFWKLKVDQKKGSAVLTCERDKDDVVITQNIDHTDFPLPDIDIWVEAGECGGRPVMVAMLPGER